ncbi:MAG: hypothetical protein LC793_18825 [Thermomicrobia bacterium]|nr:hypothetical protein [Thermomicrobia bacterium]MCA1724905.1 hypothetical protein [Thermomicrobia bacterium]
MVRFLTALACRAIVSPTYADVTAIFPRDWDEKLPPALSAANKCTVLFTQIYDGDILLYWLYIAGNLVDTYDSYPGYFGAVPASRYAVPEGGDVAKLCAAFDVDNAADSVERILRLPNRQPGIKATDFYADPEDRYRDLAAALGLPSDFNREYYAFSRDDVETTSYIRTPFQSSER